MLHHRDSWMVAAWLHDFKACTVRAGVAVYIKPCSDDITGMLTAIALASAMRSIVLYFTNNTNLQILNGN